MPVIDHAAPTQRAGTGTGYLPLDDYGVVGNCKSIALISRTGSIDWWCLPHFSAPSLFAALLDCRRGGRFSITPSTIARSEQSYLDNTCVLRTRFVCSSGEIELIDFMTVLPEAENRRTLQPQQELVRMIECTRGTVEIDVHYQPRPDYGRHTPRMEQRGRLGWFCGCTGLALYLTENLGLKSAGDGSLRGRFTLRAGERRQLVVRYCKNEIAVIGPSDQQIPRRLQWTLDWWRRWSAQCSYDGPYRDAVLRSCQTLKLLTYCLSGAVVAAATTSLPEGSSGARNWDYRYCWLRDTSMVLQSFLDLGYRYESTAFLAWLLHATKLTQPQLQVLYDVYGEARLRETTLPHLEGYARCAPVRIGNDAHRQLQLDIYGEVILTAYDFVTRGGELDPPECKLLVGFGEVVRELWRRPDKGIWEIRAEARHNTYSKLMCWVALDRLLALREFAPLPLDVEAYRATRDAIRADMDRHAFDPKLNAYVGYYGGHDADASLLLMARYGFLDANDPRMAGTCALIERELGSAGLLYRYPSDGNYDGVAGPENFFGLCSFWLVDHLARRGEVARATQLFERLLTLANPLGLYAEEFSRSDGRPMGNFPQAFTHVGLITAALTLQQAQEGKRDQEIAR